MVTQDPRQMSEADADADAGKDVCTTDDNIILTDISSETAVIVYFPNGRNAPEGEVGRRGEIVLFTLLPETEAAKAAAPPPERPAWFVMPTKTPMAALDFEIMLADDEVHELTDDEFVAHLRECDKQFTEEGIMKSEYHDAAGNRVAFPPLESLTRAAALTLIHGVLRRIDTSGHFSLPSFPVPVPASRNPTLDVSCTDKFAILQTFHVQFVPTMLVRRHGLRAVLGKAAQRTFDDTTPWYSLFH